MENLSHSLSRKAYNNANGFAANTVYTDVFGGPAKFGVSTLSPRVEDYTEIFGSFHASRASSIPILDLPVVEESDVSFDVRSFDYSQVFGGFNGLDFAISYEEVFSKSNGGDNSSDEAWSPAESGSLSDELDPSVLAEKNQSLLNEDSCQSSVESKQFNISYNKANQRSKEDMTNGMTHVTQLHAVPGFTVVLNGNSQKIEDEIPPLEVLDDLDLSMDFSGGIKEGKRFRKTMSLPSNSTSSIQTFGSDLKLPKGYGKTDSFPNEAFITVSNISLRTRPSQLPPPSRPPPALCMEEGDFDKQNTKLTASKSYAFEGKTVDSSPPFLDVEVDASSSAVASAVAMKDAMQKAQAKLKSAKELMQRKKEGLQSCMKMGLKNDLKDKEEKPTKIFDGLNSSKDVRVQGICDGECREMESFAGEEKQKAMKTSQVVSDYIEGERNTNLGKKYAKEKHGKEFRPSIASHRSERTVAWREGTQFYEVVETDEPKTNFEPAKDEKIFVQNKSHEQEQEKKAALGAFELQKEVNRKNKAARGSHKWEGSVNKLEMAEGTCKSDENKGMSKATRESCWKGLHEKKVEVAEQVCEWEQNVKKPRVVQLQGDIEKILTEADICEKHENLTEVQQKENQREVTQILREANERTENEKRFRNAHEREGNERRHKETLEREKYEKRLREAIDQAESEKRLKEALEQEEKEKQQKEAREREEHLKRQKKALERKENEKRLKEAFEREENEKRLKEASELEENEKRLKEALEQEENEKRLKEALEQEENEKRLKEALEREENEKRLKKTLEQEETEKGLKIAIEREELEKRQKLASEIEVLDKRIMGALKQKENQSKLKEDLELEENAKKQKEAHDKRENEKMLNKACEGEEKRLEEAWEQEENKKISQEAHERDESEKRLREAFNHVEIDKRSEEASEREETESRSKNAGKQDEFKARSKDREQTERDKDESKKLDQESVNKEGENFKASDGPCKLDNNKKLQATQVRCEHDKSSEKLKVTEEALSCEGDRIMRTEPEDCGNELEAIGMENELVEETFNACGMVNDELQDEKNQIRMEDVADSLRVQESVTKSGEADIGIGQTHIERKKKASEMVSDPGSLNIFAHEQGERGTHIKEDQVIFDQEESKDKLTSWQVVKEWVEIGRKMVTAQPTVLEGKGNEQKDSTNQKEERKEKNLNETLAPEEREKEERMTREIELEKDRLKRIEEEREREREREKDRMSIERATREVRERAFADARERAERAAVERATAEVRQRALAEARERLEKACAEVKERSLAEKASMEARLRAERAAVERATAEARERAVEKAMSEKAAFEARERVERSVAGKFYGSSRDGVMRQCSSSSDMQDLQFQRVGLSTGSRYLYSSVQCGVQIETAQRCKARLERHQRTAERAAKALAEKNMRDLLAQREQAERNRLAEVLDAEIKRWSSGKEGNLRALLSTLQYILGPDSGWQPIPLTEVITTVAVKKAYRKATLCVHPDKLQQRGANIQQKYICEKVFDLLKEAWNKFNSEER